MASRLSRRQAIGVAVAAGTLGASRGRAQDLADVELRIGDQKGNGRALLEAAGGLDDVPYTIVWSEFPAAAPLLEALNAGAIDTGLVGDAPMIFAQAAGVPLKAVGAWRSDPVGTAIVVPEGSPLQTAADLKGKRIATGKGSVGHYLALAALESAGLTPADAEIRFLLPAEAKSALAAGAVDAWSTWDPYTSFARLEEGARTIADGRGLSSGLGFQVANEGAIANKRAALEDYLKRLAAARVWSLDHIDDYGRQLARLLGLPAEVGVEWFGRARTQFVLFDAKVEGDQQRTIDTYARHGVIRPGVRAAAGFDPSFNPAVAAYALKS